MKKNIKNKIENQTPKNNLNEIIEERNKLTKELEKLAGTIDKVEDEKLEIENQLKRALADYHNLVSNSEKRNEIRYFQTRKRLCESVIPSLDSLNLAIKSSQELKLDEKGKSWLTGINAIFQSLNKSFEEFGLKQYLPEKGEKFDPNIHEAVATVEQGNGGEIYDLVQPGYILDNTVIRPARVVVSK